ncbi:MAG: hypothetical protein HOK11_02350 [Rhodospirillaceae bacterium]|jgi:hypothetical protein|nr:hypothetical protein [Rhodospirillaceae bacterium]
MSATVLKFPRRKKATKRHPKPRQRVFYAGYRYTGPAMCQDVQQVYLKRHGNEEWSLIFYCEGRSWEIDRFEPIDVPRKLDEYRVHDAPTREELETMGWHDPDDENVYHIAFYRHLGVE